jgi:uncharacterized NAD(P)/FAD-binding protein YdhS
MRPYTNAVWSGLSRAEQRRFLRHLARYWEVHRHRMAPQIAILVRGLVADGMLTVHRGHLARVGATRGGFEAVSRTGTAWRAGTVVNCCGAGGADRTPLGRTLLGSGMARPDPLGLGLDVDARGHLVAPDGRSHEHIVAIGPPRRGYRFWETTAVPEIRAQAAEVAGGPARLLAAA